MVQINNTFLRRISLLCVMCCGMAWGVSAQQATKPDARVLMQESMQAVSSLERYSVDIHFSQSGTTGKATLQYLKGKYRLTIGDIVRIYDGQYLYTIMPDIREVNIESSTESMGALGTMSDILNIFARNLMPYSVEDSRGDWVLTLLPKKNESTSGVQSVIIAIDKKTRLPRRITELAEGGADNVIEISNIDTSAQMPQELFVFDSKAYQEDGYYISRP